jgi:ketosteroid isomerase-like protein
VDDLASLMTEEHKFIDSLGNPMVGREKMRAAWENYFNMVPDYTITVDETLSDGPVVVMLGTAQGTYRDPAKGGSALLERENRWSTPAVFRAFIEDGKVSEWRVYADNEPMRKLMGNRK